MGKPIDKFRVMDDLGLQEISMVDNPMQEGARVAILKRAQTMKRIAITTQTGGHAHSILTAMQGGEARVGQTSYVDGHSHDWVSDEAGQLFIADANGHSHGIAVLTKNDNPPLANQGGNGDTSTAAGASVPLGGQPNTDANKSEDVGMTAEQIAALNKAAQDATKRAERAESVLKLSAEQRAHFDSLKSDAQDAFLAQSDEQREQVVKNLRDSNPVVFKSLDGTEYRKSDDARLVKMARERDEDRKTLLREQAIRKQAELEKRAGETLPNLSGTIATKAALLGAVEGIENETVRASVLETLKQQDAGLGAAFQRIGSSGAPNSDVKKAGEKLDDLAAAYATTHKIPLDKAYDAVVRTAEGARLFQEHRMETGSRRS